MVDHPFTSWGGLIPEAARLCPDRISPEVAPAQINQIRGETVTRLTNPGARGHRPGLVRAGI